MPNLKENWIIPAHMPYLCPISLKLNLTKRRGIWKGNYFSLPGNQELTQSLAQKLKIEQGEAEIRSFPDGESYIRIHSEVKIKPQF